MPDDKILLERDGVRLALDGTGTVATVTLCNPAKRNAQSPALWGALTEAGRMLPGQVRVAVLRAEARPSPPVSTGRRSRPRASTAVRRSWNSGAAPRPTST